MLGSLIYTYVVASTTPGQDAALVFAQTAIELLAWSLFVETEKMLSREGFDSLPTADKVRMLTSRMRLESDFNASNQDLQKWTAAHLKRCQNRYWAMVELRNRIVHPKKRDEIEGFGEALWEAYQLAMQILEYGILYCCKYTGKVTDRVVAQWVGETILVPWK